ncbi:MAG: Fic family protein [Moraxellaceae bacterium]|nr:Fic family protein [Moraxellaceae bacterium]
MKTLNPQQSELSKIKEKFHALLLHSKDEQDTLRILQKIYPQSDDLAELIEQISDLKRCLDSFRPLNQAQLENLNRALDMEYTYESNRIEGNTLTLVETDLVINKGITIGGKPIKDHQEAINHHEAVQFIREITDNQIDLDEKVLLHIHSIILAGIDRQNAGCYRSMRVRISGSRHICPNPIKVPNLMYEYFQYYQENKECLHPVQLASDMHEKLVTIHPFIDGNGRTARLIMNLILLKNGYPITVINSQRDKRQDYYHALEQSQLTQDNTVFQILVANYVKQWLFNYLDMFSANLNENEKGDYFFRKIEPYL